MEHRAFQKQLFGIETISRLELCASKIFSNYFLYKGWIQATVVQTAKELLTATFNFQHCGKQNKREQPEFTWVLVTLQKTSLKLWTLYDFFLLIIFFILFHQLWLLLQADMPKFTWGKNKKALILVGWSEINRNPSGLFSDYLLGEALSFAQIGFKKESLWLARSLVKWNLVLLLIPINCLFADKDMIIILQTSKLGIVFYYWKQISIVPPNMNKRE